MENITMNIPKEKFQFVTDRKVGDKKLDTKPVGYFKDAWNRFKKNKGSVVAAWIILLLVLFAIIAPLVSPYTVSYNDPYFSYCQPKIQLAEKYGWDFWDGCTDNEINERTLIQYLAREKEVGVSPIKNGEYKAYPSAGKTMYSIRFDSYRRIGMTYENISMEEYLDIQRYQNEKNIQVIYPIVLEADRPDPMTGDETDANFWFKTKIEKGKTVPAYFDENGAPIATPSTIEERIAKLVPAYAAYTGADSYNSLRVEGETPLYNYSFDNTSGKQVRVDSYQYYIYKHTQVLKDGITEPIFWFGSTDLGYDVFTRLGSGAQTSFMIAIIVSIVNMIVGAIYGAIEGYYGGTADLLMERFSEILGSVPTMIVITLIRYYFNHWGLGGNYQQLIVLFISFFLTGWIGMAGTVRMQFYRFKHQEYVLAARTLGASDARIMFKHIFPNSLGTIVTSSVLVIPGMIFSESSLSYLGIINLSTGEMTSVGNMLADAQAYLSTYPYMMLFPALFISLLMLSFNLFGNGLRDAFNPSLRGSED